MKLMKLTFTLEVRYFMRGATDPWHEGIMKITYYGHSCFSVEVAGKILLFDPFISENPFAKEFDVEFIRCSEILGVHYDTFPPIKIDKGAAVQRFRAAGKKLHLLMVGESHVV